MKKLYDLTDKQVTALLSAAVAVLAGEEGAGDAQGVNFKDLQSAANALRLPTMRGVGGAKRGSKPKVVSGNPPRN
jgi:hypothetical protein